MWEDALDKVAAGKVSLSAFQEQQKKWITQIINDAKNTNIVVASAPSPTAPVKSGAKASASLPGKAPAKSAKKVKQCPQCNKGEMLPKVAKVSGKKFLGCSNYPECKHTEWPKS